MQPIKIIECPRDAMQGIKLWIPTQQKIDYIQSLLSVGFDTIDFGSFVSPRAIPQMQDTEKVLDGLDLSNTKSKLLSIVANTQGAKQAAKHPEIQYLGYPFSISENFQMRNTHQTIGSSIAILNEILEIATKSNKQVVAYLSMGFGNPYDEVYSPEIVEKLAEKLVNLGVEIIVPSDTVGVSSPENITSLWKNLTQTFPKITFGMHLHSNPNTATEKINAAYEAGCRRIDTALRGFGGCPMAKDDLVGNIATEKVLSYFKDKNIDLGLNMDKFNDALKYSLNIFH